MADLYEIEAVFPGEIYYKDRVWERDAFIVLRLAGSQGGEPVTPVCPTVRSGAPDETREHPHGRGNSSGLRWSSLGAPGATSEGGGGCPSRSA